MSGELTPMDSIDALEAALQESFTRPVLILKHSRACGLSAQAFEEVKSWLGLAGSDRPSYLITVQTGRAIAREVTERFGIRHESPQALVVREGRVTWHASHFRVTASAIEKALS
ncbi:MAG: bacillithiol system redox-active protein YtxJ [Acidobacteria bacterium]|nr:bacillithiol system redox-active protein YtxJ [Acidobacteriota bacterium]